MKVLIQTLGSSGDTYPFVGIGRDLRHRGHEVSLFGNEVFEDVVTDAGLRFIEMGDAETYDRLAADPDVWHPRKGIQRVFGAVVDYLGEAVDMILDETEDADVVVASSLGWGARMVREITGVPLVMAHLAPALFRSAVRLPRTEVMWVRDAFPMWVKQLWWRTADVLVDRLVGRRLNEVRSGYGLRPVTRILDDWAVYSPETTLGLFPEWFGPPQSDWRHDVHLTGFPMYDGSVDGELDVSLDTWLDEGEPPIVFTSGSGNRQAGSYFREATEAADRLGRRALLVTSNGEDVPARLPSGVRHESFVPFSGLLTRVSALVSNGGIGTCAQALAAGIPHLVVHANFDQRDNGSRLEDVGAGLSMPVSRFRGVRARRAVEELLVSTDDTALRDLADRIDGPATRARACDLIESTTLGPGSS